jgi:hypothetical protein
MTNDQITPNLQAHRTNRGPSLGLFKLKPFRSSPGFAGSEVF